MMERFVILPAKSETDLANAADLFRAYAAALPVDLGYRGSMRSWPACPANMLRRQARC